MQFKSFFNSFPMACPFPSGKPAPAPFPDKTARFAAIFQKPGKSNLNTYFSLLLGRFLPKNAKKSN